MDEQRMMLFAHEEFFWGGQSGVHDTYIHRSRIFMDYRIRTAFHRTQKNVLEKNNDAYSLPVRVQTTINHILICFVPQYQRQRKCFFFFSERELKKALRDTLARAVWYGLLSTMAN